MAVAISGGVDSLALVYLLVEHRRTQRLPVELVGIHVRLDADGETAGLDPSVADWCAEIGLAVEQVLPRFDVSDEPPFDCFHCARLRRRTLLEAADRAGCTRLALGHHADDVVETWLTALFYTGRAEAMVPVRSYFDGAVTVVRPLFEMQKRELLRLGRLADVPASAVSCSREADNRRVRIVEALRALGRDEGLVRRQLFWAAVRDFESDGEARKSG